jgi:hypothetical protein
LLCFVLLCAIVLNVFILCVVTPVRAFVDIKPFQPCLGAYLRGEFLSVTSLG